MEHCEYCGKECKDKKGVATHIRFVKECQEKWLKDQEQKRIEYDKTHTFVYCKVCGAKLRNISNTHLKKHNMTMQDYKRKFPDEPLFAEGLLKEQNEKREATLDKYHTDENGKRMHYLTLEKCIAKYGESEGLRIWNEHKRKCTSTLENFTRKYGAEEGQKRYERKCAKMRGKRTLEYFINKYGEEEGNRLHKEYHDNLKGFQTLEWFVNKYGQETGRDLYDDVCKKKALTLDNFVRKYGEEEGRLRYEEYYREHYTGFRQSNAAMELFNKLMENEDVKTHKIWFDGHPKEFGKYLHEIDKYVFFDFFDEITGRIIEFNGDYWHANPLVYEADSIIHMPAKTTKIAKDIWQWDEARNKAIESEYGYKVLVIWQKDWLENPDEVIQRCLKFLLD